MMAIAPLVVSLRRVERSAFKELASRRRRDEAGTGDEKFGKASVLGPEGLGKYLPHRRHEVSLDETARDCINYSLVAVTLVAVALF